jgi:hypothetical protein
MAIDQGSGTTLQALQQAGNDRGGMQADQQMQVCGHDAEFQQPRPLLPNNDGEMPPEVCGAGSIDGRLTIAGRPDDVDQEPMMHPSGWERSSKAPVPCRRKADRFSDLSRAGVSDA